MQTITDLKLNTVLGQYPFSVLSVINGDYAMLVERANELTAVLNSLLSTTTSFAAPTKITNWQRTGYLQASQAVDDVETAVNGAIALANDSGFIDPLTGDDMPMVTLERPANMPEPLALDTASIVAISNNMLVSQQALNTLSGVFATYNFIKQLAAPSGVKAVFAPLVAPITSKMDPDNFNVGFFTDPHWQRSTRGYVNGPLSWNHIDNIGLFDASCDVLISAGDNNNSYDPPLGTLKRELVDYSNKFFEVGNHADKFMLVGNHDDGSLRNELIGQPLTPDNIINEADFKAAYRTKYLLYDEIRDGDSLWFYKDYTDKKIRMIGLNSEDIDDTLTKSDGSIRYNRQYQFAIRQAQFDFLINALLTTPADYQVLIVAHVQSDATIVVYNDASEVHHNYQIMIDLIDAFILGTAIDETGTDTDFEVTVKADFSARGKGTLIGFWNGHTHTQKFVPTGKSNFMDVHCPNSVAAQDWHVVGHASEDAFDILSVDTQARHVTIYGFGAASDREYDY